MGSDQAPLTGDTPDTAPGDNLRYDYVRGLEHAFCSLAVGRGDAVDLDDPRLALTDGGSPSLYGNMAILRRPIADGEWPDVAARMRELYSHREGGPFMVFSAWPTPDLTELGFGRVGHPPLMWRPVGKGPGGGVEGASGFEIRAVDDGESARAWEHVLVHGYPDTSLRPFHPGCVLPERAIGAPGWHHWLGRR